MDLQGIIQSATSEALTLFGYGESEVVGKNVNMLMPAPYSQMHDTFLQNYKQTRVPSMIGSAGRAVQILHKDGRRIKVHVTVEEVRVSGTAACTTCCTFLHWSL